MLGFSFQELIEKKRTKDGVVFTDDAQRNVGDVHGNPDSPLFLSLT